MEKKKSEEPEGTVSLNKKTDPVRPSNIIVREREPTYYAKKNYNRGLTLSSKAIPPASTSVTHLSHQS